LQTFQKIALFVSLICPATGAAGTSWRLLGGPLSGPATHIIAVNDSLLILGTDTAGVFRSTDGGRTWESLNAGLPDVHIEALAVGPSGSIYAGTRADGLFRLQLNSAAWDNVYRGPPVTSVAVNAHGKMCIGLYYLGTYVGSEGSTSWTYTTDNRFYNDTVHALYLTPTNDIVAGADQNIGWYKTGDANWHSMGGYMINVRSIVPATNGRIYFGGASWGNGGSSELLYIDDFENWARAADGTTGSPIRSLVCNPFGWLYAATQDSGVVVSGNNGDSWGDFNDGLGSSAVATLAISPLANLYAATVDGLVYQRAAPDLIPVAPVKLSPPNDTLDVLGSVRLRWRRALAATGYRLQVSSDPAFVSHVLVDQVLSDTSGVVTILDTVTRVYWHVLSLNSTDTSVYSGSWSFVTGPTAAAPALVSPPDGAQNLPLTVTLNWRSVPDAIMYHVDVSGSSGFLYFTEYDTPDTAFTLTGLQANISLYWRASATNIAGTGSSSAPRSFGTITPPQIAPALVAPSPQTANLPTSVAFRWRRSNGATMYDFELTDKHQLDSLLLRSDSLLTDTSITVSGLAWYTGFLWRVRGRNQWGTGPWSDLWGFSTGIEPPHPLLLVAPPDGAVDVPTIHNQLQWSAARKADWYHVQVAFDSLFAKLWSENTANGTSLTLYLRENTVFYWRVQGMNGGGPGPWSPVFMLKTVHEGNAGTGAPPTYFVGNNYPNPFNPTTTIYYGTPVATHVEITVYNSLGQKVATLRDESVAAGYWSTPWDASGLPSGVYIYMVRMGDLTTLRRAVIIK
jgi:hypothetical protein